MRPEELKNLIEQDESVHLEYKSILNLGSKEGKAKFLKEILSLTNSLQGRAYLVIGVKERDKKKEIVGMDGITEEQIQQVIAEWCRPKIDFSFQILPYGGKDLGVITIYSSRPPHTVKKKYGYSTQSDGDKHPREKHLSEYDIFVRNGSTIGLASREELIEMAQSDRDGLDAVVSRLDRIADWQEETADAIYHLGRKSNNYRDTWFSIPILIGLISGALLGYWFDVLPKNFFAIIPGVVSFLLLAIYGMFSGSGMTIMTPKN
jgi:predicted HTH transcriptional regulator